MGMVAVSFGCSSSEQAKPRQAARACDPLALEPEAIVLTRVVGAGRAADGKVYAIDQGTPSFRAFVSDGNVLQRRRVLGSNGNGKRAFVTLDDPRMLIGADNGRMGILPGEPQWASFEIGKEGELLQPVSERDLAGFVVKNIPGYKVMYAATAENGHRFLVLVPASDYRDDNLRVFYGPPENMRQREVLSHSASSATLLDFDLDGTRMSAFLVYCSSAFAFGKPRLERPDRSTIPLTPVPGSPGAMTCPSYVDAGDAAGAGAPPQERATVDELVAGGHYVCF